MKDKLSEGISKYIQTNNNNKNYLSTSKLISTRRQISLMT